MYAKDSDLINWIPRLFLDTIPSSIKEFLLASSFLSAFHVPYLLKEDYLVYVFIYSLWYSGWVRWLSCTLVGDIETLVLFPLSHFKTTVRLTWLFYLCLHLDIPTSHKNKGNQAKLSWNDSSELQSWNKPFCFILYVLCHTNGNPTESHLDL